MFEGVLCSTIALELLFGWIFSPSELDFEWFLSLQNLFFESRIAFEETCVKRFRLKNLLWWLGRRGADQEDLIICIAIWTLYKLCRPLTCDEVRVRSIASLNKLRFTSLLGPIFKDFGRPNGFPNSIFEAFFSMLFFIAFEHPILVDFSRLRTRKIMIFLRENNDFCKICVFDKNTQIAQFCFPFQRPKRRKSVQNSNPKTCCFEASNLKGFSLNFRCILESKNRQNIANIRKKWCSKASSVALSF